MGAHNAARFGKELTAAAMGLKTLVSVLGRGLSATRSKDPLAQVVADNFAGMMVVGGDGMVVAASRIASQLLNQERPLEGLAARAVLPMDMRRAVDETLAGRAPQTELALAVIKHGNDGDDRLVVQYAVTMSVTEDGQRYACLNFWDVTERRRAEGLTVLAIDLARFKPVNDALGHANGDALLKQVVSRLRATGANYVSRLGGHGFAVAHPGLTPDEAEQYADLIQDRLVAPYQLGPHRAIIGVDIGISQSSVSGFDP